MILPFADPAGAASPGIVKLAEDRFREMPNGRPGSLEDMVALLVLAIQVEEEVDPNPKVVAAKVQMDKLGFGTKLELSAVDHLGLYAVASERLGAARSTFVEGLIKRKGADPDDVIASLWSRCQTIWGRVEQARRELDAECMDLEKQLEPLLPVDLRLMPHQLQAVVRARSAGFRHIFGDDMGLGKTVEILACALLLGEEAFPLVIACPMSMVYKWRCEASKWLAKLNPMVVELSRKVNARELAKEADTAGRPLVMVGSWQQPAYHQLVLQVMNLGMLVGDESHYISNWDARRTQGFIRSRARARAVLLATGTLMENGRHREAYSQLKVIDPHCLDFLRRPREEGGKIPRGDRYPFLHRYCGPTRIYIGRTDKEGNPKPVTQFDGRSHEVEFGSLLNRHVTRRTKAEVFGDDGLPPKARYVVPVPITDAQHARFNRTRDEIRARVSMRARKERERLEAHGVRPDVVEEKVKKIAQTEAVSLIAGLRMQIGLEKAAWLPVRVHELLSEGHRPVVFCWHNDVAQNAAEACAKKGVSVLLGTGSMVGRARDRVVQQAESGSFDVVVLTSAYREGITLVHYDRVIMVERWWKPGQEQQAEDRVHRIGQTRPVAAEYLVIPGTYDDAIGELQIWKELGQIQSQGSAEERTYTWLMAA